MKNEDVYQAIKNDEKFSLLTEILANSGVGEVLAKERSVFTFFAPTDFALNRLPPSALKLIKSAEGNRLAATLLGRYIIPGVYLYSDDLRHLPALKPMDGRRVKISVKNNALRFGKAPIRTPGIVARNAVIFPIDSMLGSRRKPKSRTN